MVIITLAAHETFEFLSVAFWLASQQRIIFMKTPDSTNHELNRRQFIGVTTAAAIATIYS